MADLDVDGAVAALYASCGGSNGEPLTVSDLRESLRWEECLDRAHCFGV